MTKKKALDSVQWPTEKKDTGLSSRTHPQLLLWHTQCSWKPGDIWSKKWLSNPSPGDWLAPLVVLHQYDVLKWLCFFVRQHNSYKGNSVVFALESNFKTFHLQWRVPYFPDYKSWEYTWNSDKMKIRFQHFLRCQFPGRWWPVFCWLHYLSMNWPCVQVIQIFTWNRQYKRMLLMFK